MFYASAYTIFNIPYMSMPAEMTSESHQRSQLMSWRVIAVGLSQILAMFGGPLLVDALGGGATGHAMMALALAPIVILSSVACFALTSNAPFTQPVRTRMPTRTQVYWVVTNRPYLVLISVKLLTLSALSAQAVFPFFFERIMGASNSLLGAYFAVSSVVMIASQPAWLFVSRRLDKRWTYILALLLNVPVSLSWILAAPDDPTALIFVRAIFNGIGVGGALLMGQSMLPDTMEYDYLRTGMRREGIFAGFYTTVEKIAAAAGATIVGILLSAAGYIQSRGVGVVQPESALWAIRLIVACLPAALGFAGAVMMLSYNLSAARLDALREAYGQGPSPTDP
jgi:GPH family glycoside/pentoside/hexuronide:cation symporter